MRETRKQIEAVTFTINRQSYTRRNIEDVQLLHYRTLKTEHLLGDFDLAHLMKAQDTAELLIFFSRDEQEVSKDDPDRLRIHRE
jgi:hypothetical protein